MRVRGASALTVAAAMAVVLLGSGAPARADQQGQGRPGTASFLAARDDVPSGRSTVTYVIRAEGAGALQVREFAEVARRTLNHPRGWASASNVEFVEVPRRGEFRLRLVPPAAVAAAHPSCSREYSCRVGKDVLINARRWREGADTYRGRPLHSYRQYVINHEVGHWLGLDHTGCRGAGKPATVMQQQTIRLDGCEPRVWPLPTEIRQVRQRLGS